MRKATGCRVVIGAHEATPVPRKPHDESECRHFSLDADIFW